MSNTTTLFSSRHDEEVGPREIRAQSSLIRPYNYFQKVAPFDRLDEEVIEAVGSEPNYPGSAVGSGGHVVFTFKAKKAGTLITNQQLADLGVDHVLPARRGVVAPREEVGAT